MAQVLLRREGGPVRNRCTHSTPINVALSTNGVCRHSSMRSSLADAMFGMCVPLCSQLVGGGTVICGALVSMIPDWISPPCQKNVTDFEMACYGINNTASVMSESKCFRLHRSGSEVRTGFIYRFAAVMALTLHACTGIHFKVRTSSFPAAF